MFLSVYSAALKELFLNSSIAGPAGSGKTETVKELAKVLGFLCVVLNCSEAVDLYVLDKVFAGQQTLFCMFSFI